MINLHIKRFNINESLDNNENVLLIIENKKILYDFLMDLNSGNNYLENIEAYDENNKKIKTCDLIDFVYSPMFIDVNQKKNLNLLIRLIKNDCENLIQEEVDEIKNKIESLFKLIRLDLNIDIESDIDFTNDDLLKSMNVFIKDTSSNPIERIFNYIKVSIELRKVRCFIFYGLYDFLTKNEIEELLLNCKYLNVKIINIEKNFDDKSLKFDKKYFLDNDLCVLRKD